MKLQKEKLDEFELEKHFAKYEDKIKYYMCCSDAESMSLNQILRLGDEQCLNMWNNMTLGYTSTQGLIELREQISIEYSGLQKNNILCFAGAGEGIYCVMEGMLQRQDHIIVVTPCYQSLKSVAESICQVSLVDLDIIDEIEWVLDLNKIINSIQVNTKMLVCNYPHNPTGSLISKQQQMDMVQICRKYGIYLFCDEVYRGMEVNHKDKLEPVASIYEKGISLGVMSKAIGLAGLRIGWIATQDLSVINACQNLKHYLSICNSAPSEILSLIALRSLDYILQKNHRIIIQNIKFLDIFLDKYSNLFIWLRPKGACFGFMKFKNNSINVEQFIEELANRFKILLLPGSTFNDSKNNYSSYFRLSLSRSNFQEALIEFENAINIIFMGKFLTTQLQ